MYFSDFTDDYISPRPLMPYKRWTHSSGRKSQLTSLCAETGNLVSSILGFSGTPSSLHEKCWPVESWLRVQCPGLMPSFCGRELPPEWIGYFPFFLPFLVVPSILSLTPKNLHPLPRFRGLHIGSIFMWKIKIGGLLKDIRGYSVWTEGWQRRKTGHGGAICKGWRVEMGDLRERTEGPKTESKESPGDRQRWCHGFTTIPPTRGLRESLYPERWDSLAYSVS